MLKMSFWCFGKLHSEFRKSHTDAFTISYRNVHTEIWKCHNEFWTFHTDVFEKFILDVWNNQQKNIQIVWNCHTDWFEHIILICFWFIHTEHVYISYWVFENVILNFEQNAYWILKQSYCFFCFFMCWYNRNIGHCSCSWALLLLLLPRWCYCYCRHCWFRCCLFSLSWSWSLPLQSSSSMASFLSLSLSLSLSSPLSPPPRSSSYCCGVHAFVQGRFRNGFYAPTAVIFALCVICSHASLQQSLSNGLTRALGWSWARIGTAQSAFG